MRRNREGMGFNEKEKGRNGLNGKEKERNRAQW